jgi:hypothetical protein
MLDIRHPPLFRLQLPQKSANACGSCNGEKISYALITPIEEVIADIEE